MRLLRQLGQSEPDCEFVSKHSPCRESANGLLLRQDRMELHGQIGAIRECTFPDPLRELAAKLAERFSQGGQRETGVKHSKLAGQEFLRVRPCGGAILRIGL